MSASGSAIWTTPAIERTRATVGAIIEAKCKRMSRDERLAFLAGQVMLMREDPYPLKQLQRLFYALAALKLHIEQGGLQPRHVAQLRDMATEILERHGALAPTSRLAFLNAELVTLASWLAAKEGESWLALVEQHRANHLGRGTSPTEPGRSALDLAHRVLRLGHARHARQLARTAARRGLSPAAEREAAFVEATASRLGGAFDEAVAALAAHDDEAADWERRKIDATRARNLPTLERAVRRGERHYRLERVLETTLFLRSSARAMTHEHVPKLSSLMRRDALEGEAEPRLLRFARVLEAAQRPDVLASLRVDQVARTLDDVPRLTCVEHEMLAWTAAARWLARMNAFDLAAVALRRYRALSWSATEGAGADTLALVGDLYAKSWFVADDAAHEGDELAS